MAYTTTDLGEYAQELYSAENFEQAFAVFEQQILKLGYDGVLYTYIPRVLLDSNFSREPVYKVSRDYNPSYLKHYADARFDRHDPLIKAVESGASEPIDWWGPTSKKYMDMDKASEEVIETSRDYGIANGVTLPTLCEHRAISGASFISTEKRLYSKLREESIENLQICTSMFHNMVISRACYTGDFVKPVLDSLSNTEKQFLVGLAQGKPPAKIAADLGKSEKYLEQVMLRMRGKLSGAADGESPKINRNQLLYYAGLLNLLDYI